LKRYKWIVGVFISILALTAALNCYGAFFPGPDGKFGLWESNIWSSENSQRFADPYSFSHIVHGILFMRLWLVATQAAGSPPIIDRARNRSRLGNSRNSPLIINRYREAPSRSVTSATACSNSLSDILMMTLGFLFAWRVKPWAGIVAVIAMEVGCAIWFAIILCTTRE